MANPLSILFAFAIFQAAVSLSDVDKKCIDTYSAEQNNDFLIGTWYEIYKFSHILNLMPTDTCISNVITKPSPEDVQRYIDAYKLQNPFSFDDDPVLVDRDSGRYSGMLLGTTEAKFHIFDPKSIYYEEDKYEARAYEKINDDFILFQKCFMRGNTKWLLSRSNSTTDEELAEVIKSIEPKIRRYETQRFCKKC